MTKSQFSRLQIEGGSLCLLLLGSDNAIENNQFTGCRNAAADVFGDRNRVTLNRAEGNGTGFTISGTGNVVSRNVALRNGGDGFIISGEEATLDSNQSKYNGGEGFLVEGSAHTVSLNVARSNSIGIMAKFSSFSTFSRNRSDYNRFFGIVDPDFLVDENVYRANSCTGNKAAASEPPGLCK